MIDKKFVENVFAIAETKHEEDDLIRRTLNPISYLKEYRTITLSLGRQKGHSTHFVEYLRDKNTLYIALQKEEYARRWQLKRDLVHTKETYEKVLRGSIRKFNYILIDVTLKWSLRDKNKLYNILCGRGLAPLVIFLS